MAMTWEQMMAASARPQRQEYVSQRPINVEGYLPKKDEKLPETKKEELKRIFKPVQAQPQAAPRSVPQQAPASTQAAPIPQQTPQMEAPDQQDQQATPETLDIRRVQEQAASMTPEMGTSDWLAALAPLATEALFGGGQSGGVSYGIAGKHLLDSDAGRLKRQQTLEDKFLDLEKSRTVASAKAKVTSEKGQRRFQSINIVDPKTKEILKANFDTFTGDYTTHDGVKLDGDKIRTGFSVIPEESDRRSDVRVKASKDVGDYFGRGVRTDPTTEELGRVKNGVIEPIQGQTTGRMNEKQQKDMDRIVTNFRTSDMYKKSITPLLAASSVDALLIEANSGNPIAANMARISLSRMAGEVGTMTDKDFDRTGGDPSLRGIAKRYMNLQKTGVPLTQADIANLVRVSEIAGNLARVRLEEATGNMEKDFVENYGGVKGAIPTKMRAYSPSRSEPIKSSFIEFKDRDGSIYKVPANSPDIQEMLNDSTLKRVR